MRYQLGDKSINIPDEEIKKNLQLVDTEEEAIQLWLEDNEYIENAEQVELDKKGKATKISRGARAVSPKKTQKERVKKEDKTKENLIKSLAEFLKSDFENVTIENPTKVITFTIGEEKFKLDLMRQRAKKE